MNGRGRPLRFLALVLAGWVGARIAILWPQTRSLPAVIEALVPLAQASRNSPLPRAAATVATLVIATEPSRDRQKEPTPLPMPFVVGGTSKPIAASPPHPIAMFGLFGSGEVELGDAFILHNASQPVTIAPMPSRWSAGAWLVARPGTGLGAAPGAGQIGGSQAGLRIAYLLLPEKRVAAFARVAGPLAGSGAESAIGLEWQPTHAPVRLVAERRFGLDGTRGGTGMGIIAGIDTQMHGDLRLEAYGQAGAIWRARVEPYADGAARVTREVMEESGLRLSLGAGLWGAAQRDAQRLDVGPSVMLGVATVRFSLDWRQRVAGDARPGSGPALTIGGDF